MLYLPADVYALVERSVPLACVDFIPTRDSASGIELGLIRRRSPYGEVWCHLGGRIGRGETIREALLRHAADTLGVSLELEDDPQPGHVHQWFPPDERPTASALQFGDDERKHSIGLSFLVRMIGHPDPRDEAMEFGWFRPDDLPEPLWPGCAALIGKLRAAYSA